MTTDRPPIPPEWHDDLEAVLSKYGKTGVDGRWDTPQADRLRAALPTPEAEDQPRWDPEVVEAVLDAWWPNRSIEGGFALRELVPMKLDALAEEGFEVVRMSDTAKMDDIVTRAKSAVRRRDDRIAELEAELDTISKRAEGFEAMNERLQQDRTDLQEKLRYAIYGSKLQESGGGDADDREASESSVAPGTSPPPSTAENDLDGAAEAAREAYKTAPSGDVAWHGVVRAVRERDAARPVGTYEEGYEAGARRYTRLWEQKQALRAQLAERDQEVARLTHLLGSHADGHRCTCTLIDEGRLSGPDPFPPEWEQDPWCPTHPDMTHVLAEVEALRKLRTFDEVARPEDGIKEIPSLPSVDEVLDKTGDLYGPSRDDIRRTLAAIEDLRGES